MTAANLSEARAELADAGLDATELRSIAIAYPALLLDIIAHPGADVGLLDWIRRIGGTSVRRAVADRTAALAAAEAGPSGEAVADVQSGPSAGARADVQAGPSGEAVADEQAGAKADAQAGAVSDVPPTGLTAESPEDVARPEPTGLPETGGQSPLSDPAGERPQPESSSAPVEAPVEAPAGAPAWPVGLAHSHPPYPRAGDVAPAQPDSVTQTAGVAPALPDSVAGTADVAPAQPDSVAGTAGVAPVPPDSVAGAVEVPVAVDGALSAETGPDPVPSGAVPDLAPTTPATTVDPDPEPLPPPELEPEPLPPPPDPEPHPESQPSPEPPPPEPHPEPPPPPPPEPEPAVPWYELLPQPKVWPATSLVRSRPSPPPFPPAPAPLDDSDPAAVSPMAEPAATLVGSVSAQTPPVVADDAPVTFPPAALPGSSADSAVVPAVVPATTGSTPAHPLTPIETIWATRPVASPHVHQPTSAAAASTDRTPLAPSPQTVDSAAAATIVTSDDPAADAVPVDPAGPEPTRPGIVDPVPDDRVPGDPVTDHATGLDAAAPTAAPPGPLTSPASPPTPPGPLPSAATVAAPPTPPAQTTPAQTTPAQTRPNQKPSDQKPSTQKPSTRPASTSSQPPTRPPAPTASSQAPSASVIGSTSDGEAIPQHARPEHNHRPLLVTIAVVAVLLLAAIAFVLWRALGSTGTPNSTSSIQPLSAGSDHPIALVNPVMALDPGPIAQVSDPTPPAKPDTTALTPITVTVDDNTPTAGVQALADDLAAGRLDHIAQRCWTWPASTITAFFGTADLRQASLNLLSRTGLSALTSVVWTSGTETMTFSWPAVRSDYACPDLALADQPTPAQAALIFTRLADRAAGQPLDPADTEADYPLLCQDACTGWAFHNATQPPLTTDLTPDQVDALTGLAQAQLRVDLLLVNEVTYARVCATDGSSTAVVYFYDSGSGPRLGEIDL